MFFFFKWDLYISCGQNNAIFTTHDWELFNTNYKNDFHYCFTHIIDMNLQNGGVHIQRKTSYDLGYHPWTSRQVCRGRCDQCCAWAEWCRYCGGNFFREHPDLEGWFQIPGLVMTNSLLLKMVIYSWFTHSKWWFSIVVLVYQRVSLNIYIIYTLHYVDICQHISATTGW